MYTLAPMPMPMPPAVSGQRSDRDALEAWAQGLVGHKSEIRGQGAYGSRFTGGADGGLAGSRGRRGRGSCSRR